MNDKASCAQLLEGILEKLKALREGSVQFEDLTDENYPLPASLNIGDGDLIFITREIDQSIGALAKALMDQRDPSYRSRFSDRDWRRLAKQALGAAISDDAIRKMDQDHTAKVILSGIETQIDAWVDSIQEREFVFGCHFSKIPDLEPFSIGPVRFEPRAMWLERAHLEERVSRVSTSRISRAWQGKRLRARVSSRDASVEHSILRTVGDGDYICSVSIGLAGSEAGLQKSLIAARLALAAVALGFDQPSQALRDMVLVRDTRLHLEEHIEFSPSGQAGWRTAASFSPGVGWLTEQQWAGLASDFEEVFDAAGQAIRCFTHGDKAVGKPRIMNALFQALLWFHEAATERVDAIAIVKFCSSMDALACGRRIKGISELIQSHFTVTSVRQLDKDLKQLYNDGRSRTVHGTSDGLGHDWSSSKSRAEFLARGCLIGSLERIAKYGGPDDPKILRQA